MHKRNINYATTTYGIIATVMLILMFSFNLKAQKTVKPNVIAYYTGQNTVIDSFPIETTTYEYSSQLAVNPYEMSDPLSVIVDYMPGGYFGKYSKNVVIKSTQRSEKSDDLLVSEYSYKFDAKGNATYTLIKSVRKLGDGTILNESSVTFNLVYNCK